ncbi:MAG: ferrous iron transport protein A [Croceicoccus sp.]|nr:ferrous iron transport protein A [Croceicoccus sp.]MAL24832.1 ferrous iron transport protein A [Croceicoccus sp.]
MTHTGDSPPATSLADSDVGVPVRVVAVDWDRLDPTEGRRLRALGMDAGAVLKLAHRGILLGRDPMAVEVGRMMIALRRSHALAITVEPAPEEAPHPALDTKKGARLGTA